MLLARSPEGQTIRATPGAAASCPECAQPLIAKCGEIVAWHWAHAAITSACSYQGESEWHLGWKEWAFERGCRVETRLVEGFRADIVTPHGRVVELQSKPLALDQVATREEAYGDRLVWLFQVTEEQEERLLWGDKTYGRDGRGFFWRRGPKRLAYCTAPVYLDLADQIWEIRRLSLDEHYYADYETTSERLTGWGHPTSEHALFQVTDPTLETEHHFCTGHGSSFCPCVYPWLYENDPVAAAAWPVLP